MIILLLVVVLDENEKIEILDNISNNKLQILQKNEISHQKFKHPLLLEDLSKLNDSKKERFSVLLKKTNHQINTTFSSNVQRILILI